jgi:uncharacterized protein (TIGR03089 family)
MPESPAASPVDLLADGLRREPARPLVTYYDDTTGERTELSRTTFDNWVAKTANLLVDGLAAEPGARVALLIPLHWQTAVWLAACWSVGATPCLGPDPDRVSAGADVVVCGPHGVDAASATGAEVVALSLRAWGAGFADPLPGGALDYAAEVPSYGDRFVPHGRPPGTTEVDGTTWTGGARIDAAIEAAGRWGLERGGRLLTTSEPDRPDGAMALLPAVLALDASVVLAHGYGADAAERLAGERITAVVG